MRFFRPRFVSPGPVDSAQAAYYVFQIGYAADAHGSIWIHPSEEESPKLHWHYQTQPRRSARSAFNVFRKPDLVFLDQGEREVVLVRRRCRLPHISDIIQDGKAVGTIRLRSILLNKYSIDLNDGPMWTFWMPLFTTHFYGESNAGSRVWVVMGPKVQWFVLLAHGADDLPLVAGLAFVHRRWWCTEIF